MTVDIEIYTTASGNQPYVQWENKLSRDVRAVVTARLARVRAGNFGNSKFFQGIYELKIDYGPGYRVYFGKKKNTVILLLCAGDKSTQQRDIKKAVPLEAAAYLNAALDDEDPEVFLIALKDIAEAHGGIAKLAKKTELNRESLYRTLSSNGNPRLTSLVAILQACKLHLSVQPLRA
jgi:putative addiction module killer protein